jgi:hypothetical protein
VRKSEHNGARGFRRFPTPTRAEVLIATIERFRPSRVRLISPGALSGEWVWPDSQTLAFGWRRSTSRMRSSGFAWNGIMSEVKWSFGSPMTVRKSGQWHAIQHSSRASSSCLSRKESVARESVPARLPESVRSGPTTISRAKPSPTAKFCDLRP